MGETFQKRGRFVVGLCVCGGNLILKHQDIFSAISFKNKNIISVTYAMSCHFLKSEFDQIVLRQ